MTPYQQTAVIELVDRVQQAIRAVAVRKHNALVAEQDVDRAEVKLAQARGALKILMEEVTGDRPSGIAFETALAALELSERRSQPNTYETAPPIGL